MTTATNASFINYIEDSLDYEDKGIYINQNHGDKDLSKALLGKTIDHSAE